MIDALKIVLMSLGSALVLFLMTKLMGNKQISQLSMFDYVIGITIGSIAAGARKFIDGRALILLDNGKLYRDNFKKARIDLSEFLTICRVEGYFDLRQVQTAVMESNGKISFLPVEANRPATPSDLGLTPQQEQIMPTVIMDGHIIQDNLKQAGKDEIWLKRQLKDQGFSNEKDVFLATCDDQNALAVFPMHAPKEIQDPFQ